MVDAIKTYKQTGQWPKDWSRQQKWKATHNLRQGKFAKYETEEN